MHGRMKDGWRRVAGASFRMSRAAGSSGGARRPRASFKGPRVARWVPAAGRGDVDSAGRKVGSSRGGR